jgi:hypothetical protein
LKFIDSVFNIYIGPYAGEMMMSVQWYYKPGQTISKGNDVIKGSEVRMRV